MRLSLSPIENHSRLFKKGFTVIELVVVIIVVGILVVIGRAAYNGVQDQGRLVALKSDLSNAPAALELFRKQAADGNYPVNLDEAKLTKSDGIEFQYWSDATTTPVSYCLTGTVKKTSYYITSDDNRPEPGACRGHGINGVPAIVNLVKNPSFETGGDISATTMSQNSWAGGSGITPVVGSIPTSGAYSGSAFRRWNLGGVNTTVGYAYIAAKVPVETESDIVMSFYVRSSTAASISAYLYSYDSAGAAATNYNGTAVSVAANTWTRVSVSAAIPATGVDTVRPAIRVGTGSTSAGQNIDVDAIMLSVGTTLYNYRDGNNTNWIWNGTPNDSTSSGR